MDNITWIDWLVLVVYLVGITFVGLYATRRVKNTANFFISDRGWGKWMMMMFSFGTGTHSDQAVGVAAKAYTSGASGIWYQWLWLPVTPFYWLIAPLFRRTRALTTADYFEARYGHSLGGLYAVMGMLQLIVTIGVMLKGAGSMIEAVTDGAVPSTWAILGMTLMFVIYGMAGGLSAAIVTDFIQGIFTVVLSFLILPFALDAVGGLDGLKQLVDNPAFFELVAPGEINAFYITVIAINGLIGWVTQPHNLAASSAGRTEVEGRWGVAGGNLIKRVCTIAWVLTGMVALGLYAGTDLHIDFVYGAMAGDLLPAVAPGLIGVFVASLVAAVMSSCDAFMITSSALFTQNLYKRYIARHKPDGHYLMVGRLASLGVVFIGLNFAFVFSSVVEGLEVFWAMQAMMGIAFWVGLFWRRTTAAAAWVATLTSFIIWLATSRLELFGRVLYDFNAYAADVLPAWMLWEGQIYLPWQMICYLGGGFVAIVLVSLFTRRVDAEQLDRFYMCLRTPVLKPEPEVEPFTLPEGVEPAPRDVLIDHPDFEIPRPSRLAVSGFLIIWGLVLALAGSFFLILR
ncbi:MAG: sodium:solute symporter [Rhodothermales bacterium]